MVALRVPGERSGFASAVRKVTNFLQVAQSQDTSDVAEPSDHESLASTGIAFPWVVVESSTKGRSGGSRSLQ